MDSATKIALTVFLATTAAFGGYQAYQSFTSQYYQTFNQTEVHTGQFNKTKHNEPEHTDNVDSANGGSVIKVHLESIKEQSQKTYLLTGAHSEDSDQPAPSRSLIRIFTGRFVNSQECKVS